MDYDLEKINVEWSGPLTTVAQNNYDLEKINVEWCSKNNYNDLEKINSNVEWCAQNNYNDLKKINVELSGTHFKILCTRSWYKKKGLEKYMESGNVYEQKCSGLISPKIITTSKK